MKSYVTRWKSPETRRLVEHDEGECPACMLMPPNAPDGAILYVEHESEDGAKKVLRRVQKITLPPGINVSPTYGIVITSKEAKFATCIITTPEEAEAEIEQCNAQRPATTSEIVKAIGPDPVPSEE